jgi:hypothetical protein
MQALGFQFAGYKLHVLILQALWVEIHITVIIILLMTS